MERHDRLPLWILAGLVLTELVYFGAGAMRPAGAPALTDVSLSAHPGVADAKAGDVFDLEICNHTSEGRVFVAVAYYDAARTEWVARGWYPHSQGSCQVTLKSLKPPVYVYGETKDGHGRWGDAANADDTREFCINKAGPFVRGQRDCNAGQDAHARVRRQRFMRLELAPASMVRKDETSAPTHVWELTE